MVFGIPIGQCLENDRLSRIQRGGSPGRDEPSELRRKSHHGSRTSFSSLIETTGRGDEVRYYLCCRYDLLRSIQDNIVASVYLNYGGICYCCRFSKFIKTDNVLQCNIRHFVVTIVAVKKKHLLHILSVCL
jgi:hypothetical protein